jgi:hypothetical protein
MGGCMKTEKLACQDKSMSEIILQKNQEKFSALKKYNLPTDQYAIIGSGPLGIRGLREIGDIDIVVSPELRDRLSEKYGIVDTGKVRKIVFPGENIEAFWEGSLDNMLQKDPKDPSMHDIIHRAEIIDGLPFQSLEDLMYFKHKTKRDKDLNDIILITKWQEEQCHNNLT